jgi:hypothetical protein
MTEKYRFFSRKEENKTPDEGKSLMSLERAKDAMELLNLANRVETC